LPEGIPLCSINSHIPSDKTVYHHVSPILRSVKFLCIESDDGPVFLRNEQTVQRVTVVVHGNDRKLIIIKIFLCLIIFRKSVQNGQASLKSDKNNQYFYKKSNIYFW